MRSLGASIWRRLTIAIELAIGAAAVTAAVAVIGFTVVAVALHVWRSDPPKAAISGIRCHWDGRYLRARGAVLNFGGRDATFDVRPDVALTGRGVLSVREEDFVTVRAGAVREWRWLDGHTRVPSGAAVTRCSASVFYPGGGEGDD